MAVGSTVAEHTTAETRTKDVELPSPMSEWVHFSAEGGIDLTHKSQKYLE